MSERERTGFGEVKVAAQNVAKNHTGKTIVGSVALITALVNFVPIAFDKIMAKGEADDARIDASHEATTTVLKDQIVDLKARIVVLDRKDESNHDRLDAKQSELNQCLRDLSATVVSSGGEIPDYVTEAAADLWDSAEEYSE